MYVSRIKSNVKSINGGEWTLDIGKKTLLIGPNESGKSAIVEALLLACTGSTTGLFLRPGLTKKDQDLIALKPEGEDGLFSVVSFSADRHGEPVRVSPPGTPELIPLSVRWETSQDEDGKVKRGKQNWSPGPFSVRFPLEELKTALRGSPDTAYKLLFERLHGDNTLPIRVVGDDWEELKPYLPDLGSEWGEHSQITGMDFLDVISKVSSKRRKILAESKQLDAALKSYTSIESVAGDGLLEKWESLFRSLQFEYLKKAYQNNGGLREFIAEELRALGTPAELQTIQGSAIISEELEKFIERRVEVRIAKNLKDRASSAAARAKALGLLEKSLTECVYTRVETRLPVLCARASSFLPKGESVGFEADRNKIRFGIKRGSVLYTAMSGSTEVRVLTAIAASLYPTDGAGAYGERCSVIVLDDRMWDAATLGKTLAALEKCPAQILIMSTVKPKGRMRDKWMYIEADPFTRGVIPPDPLDSSVEKQEAQAPLL